MKKNYFQKLLLLLSFAILLLGCRQEVLFENNPSSSASSKEDIHKRFSSSWISSKSLKQSLKNQKLRNSFEEHVKSTSNTQSRGQFGDILIYEKVVDSLKNITTYTLPLIKYSSATPYYLKHIITVENDIEKEGFIKIIPANTPVSDLEILTDFTGTVQILDVSLNIYSQSSYVNGIPQHSENNNNPTSNRPGGCYNQVTVITNTCTNGGNHLPGQSCGTDQNGNQLVNNAYYEIINTLICTPGGPDLELTPPSTGTISGGGGGDNANMYELLNDPSFLYADYITWPNRSNLLNLVGGAVRNLNYVDANTISQLNQKVGLFYDNDHIFTGFDTWQDLLNSAPLYLGGNEGNYDPRIANLIKYLFDNPTQANADFVDWANYFFLQNTSPQGYCDISWGQFQNWFMNGYTPNFRNNINLNYRNLLRLIGKLPHPLTQKNM